MATQSELHYADPFARQTYCGIERGGLLCASAPLRANCPACIAAFWKQRREVYGDDDDRR